MKFKAIFFILFIFACANQSLSSSSYQNDDSDHNLSDESEASDENDNSNQELNDYEKFKIQSDVQNVPKKLRDKFLREGQDVKKGSKKKCTKKCPKKCKPKYTPCRMRPQAPSYRPTNSGSQTNQNVFVDIKRFTTPPFVHNFHPYPIYTPPPFPVIPSNPWLNRCNTGCHNNQRKTIKIEIELGDESEGESDENEDEDEHSDESDDENHSEDQDDVNNVQVKRNQGQVKYCDELFDLDDDFSDEDDDEDDDEDGDEDEDDDEDESDSDE